MCAVCCVAQCLGSGEAQLPQLSTLALALKSDGPLLPGCPWTPCSPAHCSLGPRTLQMIYYPHREGELSPNLSSPPSQSFSPSSLFTPHASPITFSLRLSQTEKSTPRFQASLFHFITDSPFFYWNFSFLSLLLIPFFCVSCSWRTQGLRSLSHVFLIPLLFYFSSWCEVRICVRCSICNSQSTKAESSCLCLCHTNRHQILSD